ncbi:MAG TPA: prepilin-type N-terminal cleavage/methylation domain-containing protein, partial [Candidatus Paceibacterota bacterium]|nr:prepilin-type N-terminal cleavage/methylation domain-containing protein [Candidatus Paceibacterota bacterium]
MKFNRPLNTLRGLTLIEVLVVIAIIGILAAVISVNAVKSGQISRDAKRQADLRMLQSAVELYKSKNGRYPYACNAPEGAWADVWSGQSNSGYPCQNGSTQYIMGLAPEFIPVLPYDEKINANETYSGYVYRTNAEGSVYKIMAMRTVESELVGYNHEFESCHIIPAPSGDRWGGPEAQNIDIAGWCHYGPRELNEPPESSYGTIHHCIRSIHNGSLTNRFDTSYGVWGGFGEEIPNNNLTNLEKAQRVRNTTMVIC